MSKTNYKRLGDYIREVDIRNRDLKVKLSQGISNEKYFQQPKQVAINPYNDKIVRKGQFAFNRATTRNGDKISIAYREAEDCTVSASYCVFDVKNEDILSPKYLMMWFKRPEFDRYAIYHSHGSAHEYFTFENMCEVELPIPPIDQQRKIVAEYNAIQRRIKLNEQQIVKLEETTQAIYRKMFVDGIDKNNLPEGWRMGTLGEIADFKNGKATKLSNGIIPVYGGNGIVGYTNTFNTENVVVIGRVGINCGNAILEPNKCWVNDNAIMTMSKSDNIHFLYWLIREMDLNSQSEGSGQPLLTQAVLNQQYCIIPDFCKIESFDNKAKALALNTFIKQSEIVKLNELQSLILAKMGK